MFNNRSILNRALTNGNYGSHSNTIRYLTPCEILKEYLVDPCSIFNGTIVPVDSTTPVPPMPLPPLPIPPFPPGPIISRAQFIAQPRQVMRPDFYVFDHLNLEGPDIQHVNGTSEIILTPNKIYEFDWITESLFGVDMNFRSGSVLKINNNIILPGSLSTVIGNGLTPIIAQGNLRYMILPGQNVITLENVSVPNMVNTSEATLTITEIL